MNKSLFFLFGIAIVFSISSCSSPSYFIPAATGNDVSYLPKPMGSDSIKTRNYVSASLASLALPYATGDINMGFVNFSRAHTTKHLNIAYGVFGFAGETNYESGYHKKTTIPEFDGKGLIGGGLRTSIGYYDYAGPVEFRILSWENALSFESGAYADFRKRMNTLNDPNIISSTKTTLYTTGGATEIIFHSKRNLDNHFAFRFFYGFTPGLNQSIKTNFDYQKRRGTYLDFTFYFKLNKFYGILSSGGNRGFSNKLSLGYSF
ncbi:hypothetical protein [Pedobacter sp. Hv1]|uniref:hypothetical protein n=1 Tax=Pedobacter sp. Hv1 TaxID=1740090 RepID=UPI0006D88A2C|nr:hypothetical protein [Pedobacter sp. Hv1]KQC01132.1 hypothetical protein AQF98_10745 [Pedobacter sp. Hv1]